MEPWPALPRRRHPRRIDLTVAGRGEGGHVKTWRSLLYVPGIQERMLARAPSTGADGLILDLEASVPPAEKLQARAMVAKAIPQLAAATAADLFVRVNTLASGLIADEIKALAQPGLKGIVLPATESTADVQRVTGWLAQAEAAARLTPGTLVILVILETARGVLRAYDLLTASPRVAAMLFGAEDFRESMGVPRSRDGLEVRHARAAVALAARAADLVALDVVYTDLEDEAGLVEETRQGRLLGYTGKQVIHPKQIPVVHRALAPTGSEIAWATRVVAEAERQAADSVGAFVLDGRMIDRPVIAQARQVLAWAEEQRHD
jgi:citrate lyase beta subunit